MGRVITSGYIAGRSAASVDKDGFATADTALDPAYAGSETNSRTKTNKAEYFSFRGSARATKTHSEKETELAALATGKKASAASGSIFNYTSMATKSDAGNTFVGASDKGMGGTIRLQITVEKGKMTAIKVIKHSETAGIGPQAMEKLTAQALQKQSANLDVVSGATMTSDAFKEALSKAMKKAKL